MTTLTTPPVLPGTVVPTIIFPATDGRSVNLAELAGTTVVYFYPRTSRPDEPPIEGWDEIPGARGCTLQCREFAERYEAIITAGATHVFGVSTQNTDDQREAVDRLLIPFPLLSDESLSMAVAMELPTFEAGGLNLFKRITLVLQDGVVRRVFFPVVDPRQNVRHVLEYLENK